MFVLLSVDVDPSCITYSFELFIRIFDHVSTLPPSFPLHISAPPLAAAVSECAAVRSPPIFTVQAKEDCALCICFVHKQA